MTLRSHICVVNTFDRDVELKVTYAPPEQPPLSWSARLRGASQWCGADIDAEAPIGNGSSAFHRWAGQESVAVLPLFVVAGLRAASGSLTLRVRLQQRLAVVNGQHRSCRRRARGPWRGVRSGWTAASTWKPFAIRYWISVGCV